MANEAQARSHYFELVFPFNTTMSWRTFYKLPFILANPPHNNYAAIDRDNRDYPTMAAGGFLDDDDALISKVAARILT